jgi:hypothetical protein
VRALLKLAVRYECQSLTDRCEVHLINCIEIPVAERLNIADSYGLKDLKVFIYLLKLQRLFLLIHEDFLVLGENMQF